MELNNELKKHMLEFKKHFGYMPALKMISPVIDNDTLINVIQECIKENEDNFLNKLGVHIDKFKLY